MQAHTNRHFILSPSFSFICDCIGFSNLSFFFLFLSFLLSFSLLDEHLTIRLWESQLEKYSHYGQPFQYTSYIIECKQEGQELLPNSLFYCPVSKHFWTKPLIPPLYSLPPSLSGQDYKSREKKKTQLRA